MRIFRQNIATLSDADLLGKYREKYDPEYSGELFNRYLHLVYGVCLKYLGNRDDSQDAVMTLYEMISDKLKTHEVVYFKSWLYMVTKNHCLMTLRKRKGEHLIGIDESLFMENQPAMHLNDETVDMEGNLTKLEKCMEELKQQQQQCVRLFYLEEKSYQEVSRETRFPLKEVKSYIQNGKRNLKLCMERND